MSCLMTAVTPVRVCDDDDDCDADGDGAGDVEGDGDEADMGRAESEVKTRGLLRRRRSAH